jgi:hypothetical protein
MRVPRSIYAQPQTLGNASVSDAGFGVAPKQASPQIQNAERNAAFREVSDRETHALPRAARLPRAIGITCYLLMAITISAAPKQASSAVSNSSVIRMQQDAWNHGDIDRFMNGYARQACGLCLRRYGDTRMGNGADRYRENIPIARMGFQPPISKSTLSRFGRGAGTLGIIAGKRSAARAIYAHLQTLPGRMADCARSHISGSAAVILKVQS